MQTNVNNVYAIGDILGPFRIMLAHVASAEGIVATENAMGLAPKMDYQAVPAAIFTSPEVACVGLSEQQAIGGGYETRAESVLFRTIGKAQVTGEIGGEAKKASHFWRAGSRSKCRVHNIYIKGNIDLGMPDTLTNSLN